MLTEAVQKQNHRISCNKNTPITWDNLPQNVRKLWAFLAVNQSFPSPLNEWTIKQIAQFVYRIHYPNFYVYNYNLIQIIVFVMFV